jgi:hypothetical protein
LLEQEKAGLKTSWLCRHKPEECDRFSCKPAGLDPKIDKKEFENKRLRP